MLNFFFIIALVTLFFSVTESMILKYVMPKFGKNRFTILILGIGVIPMLAIFLFSTQTITSLDVIAFSVLGGIFLGLGYLLYYITIEDQEITLGATLQQSQPAVILLFSIFVLLEPVSPAGELGIALIFIGSFIVLIKKGFKLNRKLIPAFFGGISWGTYWILMSYAINSSGYIEQLTIARGIAFIFFLIYAYSTHRIEKQSTAPRKGIGMSTVFALILIMGIFDSFINIDAGYLDYNKVLSLVGASFAVTPVVVAVLARYIFKDKLTKTQWIGFIIVVLGLAGIAIG